MSYIREHIFSAQIHGTYIKINHVLGHKENNKFYKVEILQTTFSDNNLTQREKNKSSKNLTPWK